VGIAILSSQGDAEIEPGEGALVEGTAVTGTSFPNNYLVRFREGVDPDAAAGRLRRDFFDSTAYPTFPPTIVRTVERVAYLPAVLAAVVVVLALGTLVHGLVVVLRRRRRDLAVMQAVGFTGRQVLESVGIQATTIALVGLLAGIPTGLALGHIAWRLTARALGVAAPPALPWLGLVALGVLTVLVVNLLALGPGWRAQRAQPGLALRAE
jgi:putative ABC transport system permease protein